MIQLLFRIITSVLLVYNFYLAIYSRYSPWYCLMKGDEGNED